MELSLIKQFLKVDFDDDDSIISLTADAAEQYITAAVGSCINQHCTRLFNC